MRYVSLFSGIEAATVAWEGLGFQPLAFSEIDAFPSAVLAERFPAVSNLGDITKVDWGDFLAEHGRPDVVVGGSPCQSFSVAGNRTGLAGASGLMWEYVRAVRELRPRWLVWENVPGALSSTGGDDFGCLLRSLDELGYGLAWTVLDAQYFGVAQRRRRLFVVGSLGDGGAERACEVLFDSDCMRGNPPTGREKRQALARRSGRGPEEAVLQIAGNVIGREPENGGHQLGVRDPEEDGAFTLTTADRHAVAYGFKYHVSACAGTTGFSEELAPTQIAGKPPAVCMTDTQPNTFISDEVCGTLTHRMHKDPPLVAGDVS